MSLNRIQKIQLLNRLKKGRNNQKIFRKCFENKTDISPRLGETVPYYNKVKDCVSKELFLKFKAMSKRMFIGLNPTEFD